MLFDLMDKPNLLKVVAPLLDAIDTEIQTGCTCHISTHLLTILPPGYDVNDKNFQAHLSSLRSLVLGNKPAV